MVGFLLLPFLMGLTISDQPLLKDVHRIVCMGDSITEGGEHEGGYVWIIRKVLGGAGTMVSHGAKNVDSSFGIEVINAGISGHKSTDMRARFKRDVLDKKPDLVTISVGVNDVWHGFDAQHPQGGGPNAVPLQQYIREVQAMIDGAQAQNIKVVLLAPTPIYENADNQQNKLLAAYVIAMRDLSKQNGCAFIDLNKAFWDAIKPFQRVAGKGINLLTGDGVHMIGPGNRLMAHQILKGLGVSEPALAKLGY